MSVMAIIRWFASTAFCALGGIRQSCFGVGDLFQREFRYLGVLCIDDKDD